MLSLTLNGCTLRTFDNVDDIGEVAHIADQLLNAANQSHLDVTITAEDGTERYGSVWHPFNNDATFYAYNDEFPKYYVINA